MEIRDLSNLVVLFKSGTNEDNDPYLKVNVIRDSSDSYQSFYDFPHPFSQQPLLRGTCNVFRDPDNQLLPLLYNPPPPNPYLKGK